MCLTFKKCCCCVSLEVGAQIISIVSTAVSACLMLVYGSAATLLPVTQESRTQLYGGLAALAGCQCLLGFLLIYGVFMKRPRLLWPWSVFCWCKSVALLALCVLGYAALAGGASGAPEASVMISLYTVYSVLLFYCACVVNSRRLQLVQEPYSDYRPTLALSASEYPYPVKP